MEIELLERDPRLAEVVRKLVEAYRPERVYLFGSVARGEVEPDSDYDLLVGEEILRLKHIAGDPEWLVLSSNASAILV